MYPEDFLKWKGLLAEDCTRFVIQKDGVNYVLNDLLEEFLKINTKPEFDDAVGD